MSGILTVSILWPLWALGCASFASQRSSGSGSHLRECRWTDDEGARKTNSAGIYLNDMLPKRVAEVLKGVG